MQAERQTQDSPPKLEMLPLVIAKHANTDMCIAQTTSDKPDMQSDASKPRQEYKAAKEVTRKLQQLERACMEGWQEHMD